MTPSTDKELLQELQNIANHTFNAAVARLGGHCDNFMGPCSDSFCFEVDRLAKLDPNYLAVTLLIKKLKAVTDKICKHEHFTDSKWEWDDGYGTQKMLPVKRCDDCGQVNRWPTISSLWVKE